ncbi:MAG: glutaredoxin 3 [Gammaproteobacteria bacterium]|nr:glutaredoxin 3 [Gammaproteobacteria bacterium]
MDAGQVVEMYANSWCPYCSAARALLASKQVRVVEINVEEFPERRAEMVARSGRRTVPQIFIGATHVGGYDDLAALEREGRLDPLLRANH